LSAGFRLEASAFNIEARQAVKQLQHAGLPLQPLYGEKGLCKFAHNAFRFKRIYVDAEHGAPFLSSSDIISMRPEPKGYLSRKLTKRLDELLVQKWDVLISCSGTIGNVGLASETIANKAVSQHVIRLRAENSDTAGYVTAFLKSRFGRLQLVLATYGSVVQHIEPLHLKHVLIPNLKPILMLEIGRKVGQAYEWRDEANRLLDEADALLHAHLKLPPLPIKKGPGPTVRRVKAFALRWRFEGSYHDPVAAEAERIIQNLPMDIAELGEDRVTEEIRPITKFRKRVYVPKGGIPLLSSKQLFQIDPIKIKRLALGVHKKDMKEIGLQENMILITRSGTIGRVQITPAYMSNWAGSEDATRVISSTCRNPGYLYALLASDYGRFLIKRLSYGSVVVHVDLGMLSSIPVPLPAPAIENEIGDLVIKANRLRSQAWHSEREAITQLEALIMKKKSKDWL
jgi:type I restriction enzyme S subunit